LARGRTAAATAGDISLAGKTCVITGGTSGLGEATARLFARSGARVLITGLEEERGRRIEASTKNIKFRAANLEDRSETLGLIDWLDSNCERVDVLISNASRNSRHSLTDISQDEWDRMVHINLSAPFLLSNWAARRMIKTKTEGRIIIIGAIQAFSPLESSFAYVTTKGGLISMVRSMAVDLGPYGILATAVLPGSFYVKEGEPPGSLDARAATLVRRMGRPIEIARVLAFLASDNNSFMTGNMIIVDGGRVISRRPDPDEIRLDELPDNARHSHPRRAKR
jgi:glucose 1-dehydrogenase